jgi:hypothetical protein
VEKYFGFLQIQTKNISINPVRQEKEEEGHKQHVKYKLLFKIVETCPNISLITVNIRRLNSPIKIERFSYGFGKEIVMLYIRNRDVKTQKIWKQKEENKI